MAEPFTKTIEFFSQTAEYPYLHAPFWSQFYLPIAMVIMLNIVIILLSILYTWFKRCPHGLSCTGFLEHMHKSSPKITLRSEGIGSLDIADGSAVRLLQFIFSPAS